MSNTKSDVVNILKPLMEKLELVEYDLGECNTTFSNKKYLRLVSVVEHSKDDIVIVVRDNPYISVQQFADDNILPLLTKNNIEFETGGYQPWNAKIVYKIKAKKMNDTIGEMMNDTMDERMNGVLEEDKERLSKDSVAAIICLEDEIRKIKAAIALIRKGDIIAVYKGDRSKPYDSEEFILLSKREFEEEISSSPNE